MHSKNNKRLESTGKRGGKYLYIKFSQKHFIIFVICDKYKEQIFLLIV